MTWADVGWLVLSVSLFLGFISFVVLFLTYAERKFLGRIQRRLGPMRTGPFGLLQPVADAIKLLSKEDLVPGRADKFLFWIAPLIVFVPAIVIWVSIPFTRNIVIENLELGIFFVLAVMGLSIAGILMAGWSSFNKYAMLGAVRAAAQLISYELPLLVAVLGVVMIAGSLDLQVIVAEQNTGWFIVLQPVAFLLFFTAGLAEVGRTPFDIPMAESEVIGGPFVEYSGMHWSMFFLAEYANTFAIGALTTVLFLGGWSGPLLPGLLWFSIKTLSVIFFIFWLRATLPRFRIDQLMTFCWKFLIPISFLNILVTGFYLFYGWPSWSMFLLSMAMIFGGYATIRITQKRRAASIAETLRLRRERIAA